ncbi:transposase [Polaribacter sp.]|uniref:transposase n=1 Tax=Polaribacter sp. TaxID=1920175 RepID=UPI003F6CFB09
MRPIVRGKEIKSVEFGAKVNKLQIDGINFVQRVSFDNFNEGTQFKNTIYKAQRLTKTKVKIAGADAIYATNKNRVFATSKKIQTDFKPKGKPSKHRKQQLKLAKIITKERATRLEGSFGKEKEHYHLKKIKAKTEKTEILWIFFGIHTANCLEIGRRIQKKDLQNIA